MSENQITNKEERELLQTDESSSDSNDEVIKEKKPRKPFVMTEARKQAFEKARQKRDENLRLKKELRDRENEHIQLLKDKAKNKKEKKLNKLEKEIKAMSSESESEEEQIIVKKKKPKNKKKKIVYVSDSDDDEVDTGKKNVIIINNGKHDHPPPEPKKTLQIRPSSYFV